MSINYTYDYILIGSRIEYHDVKKASLLHKEQEEYMYRAYSATSSSESTIHCFSENRCRKKMISEPNYVLPPDLIAIMSENCMRFRTISAQIALGLIYNSKSLLNRPKVLTHHFQHFHTN